MDDNIEITDHSIYYFNVQFPTCNSFRQILEFLNQSHKTIPLIFSKDVISIRIPNDSETTFFDGRIYAYNLTPNYYVNPLELEKASLKLKEEGDEDSEPEIFIHVSIAPLLTTLKRNQKKQKIRMYRTFEKKEFIIIHSEEPSFIRIDHSEKDPISLFLENPIPSNLPNVATQLSSFNFSATGCGRISDKVSSIRVYERGINIHSSSTQGETDINKGICKGSPICEVSVPGDVMKSISKLSSLCDEGIVRVYCNESSYIKLEIPISVIGTANIYLMNSKFASES